MKPSFWVRLIRLPFRASDEPCSVALWRNGLVRPQNDPHKDIARKLRGEPELFLVAENQQDGSIVGSVIAMDGEGHRGWINYLAVAPSARRQGPRRTLMAAAEDKLRAAGCPKINLQLRPDNSGRDRIL